MIGWVIWVIFWNNPKRRCVDERFITSIFEIFIMYGRFFTDLSIIILETSHISLIYIFLSFYKC